MRWLRVVISLLLLMSFMAMGNAQQANYAGKAKIVLEIVSLNNVNLDDTPSYYNVHVLSSSDPAIKESKNYKLEIDEQQIGYWGITMGVTPKEFVDGIIIGINDYDFDGSKISVGVGADPKDKNAWDNAWKEKITILGSIDTNTINNLAGNLGPSTVSTPFSIPFKLDSLINFPSSSTAYLPFNKFSSEVTGVGRTVINTPVAGDISTTSHPDWITGINGMGIEPSGLFIDSSLIPSNPFSWPDGPVRYKGPLTIK